MCDAAWRELLERRATAVTEVALNPDSNGSPAPTSGGMPRLCAADMSYESFCLDFMEPNLPVVLEGVAADWRATRDWVLPDGGIDIDFLQRHFGAANVTVTDTARQHKGSGPGQQMPLSAFIAWWRQHKELQEGGPHPGTLWYCKDWHLALEFPQYGAYTCPPTFQDDWLNEWHDGMQQQQQPPDLQQQQPDTQQQQPDSQQQQPARQQQQDGTDQQQHQQRGDEEEHAGTQPAGPFQQGMASSDYRFVYLGVRGTSTPLHSDVLRSFSWSANIAGRKLWRLLPPQYSHLLLDRQRRSVAWDFFAEDPGGQYPHLAEALPHVLEVVQQPGEAIFVPSGWHHTVENLDDCVSINHNWLNGHNVHWTWALLQLERRQAEEGIEDCRELCSLAEFESLVLRNLGANAGLDYAGFGAMLRCTALRSLGCLAAAGLGSTHGSPGGLNSSWYHAFRLQRAAAVLRELLAEQLQCGRRIERAQQATGILASSGDEGPTHLSAQVEESPHAAEVAANSQCLTQIEDQLKAMGIAADVT